MSVCILKDRFDEQAALYCSTSDFAFGPVFSHSQELGKSASERAEAFLRWLELPEQSAIRAEAMKNDFFSRGRFDVRLMDGRDVSLAYSAWLSQEGAQYDAEEKAEKERQAAEEEADRLDWEASERRHAEYMTRRTA